MTKALEQAIERLRQMPEGEQDEMARLLLHEIEEQERWEQSTAAHAEKLGGFIGEILKADDTGLCEPLDPDQL